MRYKYETPSDGLVHAQYMWTASGLVYLLCDRVIQTGVYFSENSEPGMLVDAWVPPTCMACAAHEEGVDG